MFHYGEFKFCIVTSHDLIRRVQQLRYKVYVDECGFEKPGDHPEGFETDPFDESAIHVAAINANGDVVGTSRLVLNSLAEGLPIFHILKTIDGFNPHSPRLAEVSRLAVDPAFRQKKIDPGSPSLRDGAYVFSGGQPDRAASQDARTRSVITTGLISLMHFAGSRLGISQYLMISERKLWVMLKRLGIVFRQIGDPVDYHGERIPYLANFSKIDDPIRTIHYAIKCQCEKVEFTSRVPTLAP